MNYLYYGDNLDVLRRYIDDESVDLVYLDPPFKSQQNYNVLFQEQDGSRSAAQIQAFEDTWRWDQAAAEAFNEVVQGGGAAAHALVSFRTFIGGSDMLAYLSMMAPRLSELHRVLKPTGSIYLHCDPTASHYLKMLMDAVFGAQNFRNEIVWKRVSTVKGNFGQGSKFFGPNTDTILFYAKSKTAKFKQVFKEYSEEYIEKFFRYEEPDGRRYRLISMIGPGGASKGNPHYEFMGVTKYWRYSQVKMQQLYEQGMIVQTKPGAVPQRKQYLEGGKGVAVQSLWDDIEALSASAKERLGYPTQKPEALLERIVEASSDAGDVVLDPFCGCGTSIAAAEKLGRAWIGIDITHLAISLIKHRLYTAFGKNGYGVLGEPADLESAKALSLENRYQFQYWALGLVGARPVERKKGADKGIDGRLYFHDEPTNGKTKQIIFQVKSGKPKVTEISDLRGVIERENAAIGVYITLESPTKPMVTEAASAGFYYSSWNLGYSELQFPRVQIITIEELLGGKQPNFPPSRDLRTFKRAPRVKKKTREGSQQQLFK